MTIMADDFLSELHRAAVEYARDGYPIFICKPGEKVPATPNGFKDATIDEATINGWFKERPDWNIGTEPERSGCAVLDIEHSGLGAWEILQADNGCVRTFANSTPRGGKHLWLRGSLPSRVRLFNGYDIDTRGRGGYVLLPPSVVGGKSYETIDDFEIAPLPAWIAKRANERKHEPQPAAEREQDLPINIAVAKDWLSRQPAPAEGERDNKTFLAACHLKDLGCGPTTILAMLRDWEKTLPDADHERCVDSAFKNGQNEPGCDATRPMAETFANVETDEAADDFNAVPLASLLAREEKPLEELVPGLIRKHIATMLAGPNAVHKSRTAFHWGQAIAAGVPIYGLATERAHFVYLSCEDDIDEVTRRIKAMGRKLDLPFGDNATYLDRLDKLSHLAVVSDGSIEWTPFYKRLRKYLKGIDGHKFVVMDSTYDVLLFTGANTKSNETAVSAAIARLDTFCRETDSTIVYLWHPSRSGMDRGDSSGWSVAWENKPRARLSLNKKRNGDAVIEDVFELKVEKRSGAKAGGKIDLRWADGVLLPTTDLPEQEQADVFYEACIKEAIAWAIEYDNPILQRPKINNVALTNIELASGKRPTQREVKDALIQALAKKRLRYLTGHGKQKAGYYPFDGATADGLGQVVVEDDPF